MRGRFRWSAEGREVALGQPHSLIPQKAGSQAVYRRGFPPRMVQLVVGTDPPSTRIFAPLIKAARGLLRNVTVSAISSA